ncbi:MAG TPA: periplasmic heavy metal sensor [Longimicrobiales bacterium]|nr:periplasmic heavy metal sensor [Longimicrobiales bacterium]
MSARLWSAMGLVVLAMMVGPRAVAAQAVPKPEEDPFASVLFPPELIMQHGRAIRLTDEQRTAITRLIEQLQGRVLGLQWQMVEQVQTLKQTLGRSRVDQDRALDQLNRVLDTEKRIKQAHLEMLIRIKNVLRPEQQTELARLRNSENPRKNDEPQVEVR